MGTREHRLLALVAGAGAICCGRPVAPDGSAPASAASAPEQAALAKAAPCPVTVPPQPGFVPTGSHPPKPSAPGTVWFGSDELWTALPADGSYRQPKSVWWSKRFEGGHAEPKPDISVEWQRLDADASPVTSANPGTNAHTEQDGWFMIAGIDPVEPGCWRVRAKYRGSELEYVYLAR